METQNSFAKRMAAYSSIAVFVIMALEVMIMISPFAFFFYSVFSPVFNFLGQHAATRWTTMFFLPHMILPPTGFLKAVRIAGSVLFVAGFLGFTICALQVYLGKIFKWGIASKGIYKKIRHPQYLLLGIWGIGMEAELSLLGLTSRTEGRTGESLQDILSARLGHYDDDEGVKGTSYGFSAGVKMHGTAQFRVDFANVPQADELTRPWRIGGSGWITF